MVTDLSAECCKLRRSPLDNRWLITADVVVSAVAGFVSRFGPLRACLFPILALSLFFFTVIFVRNMTDRVPAFEVGLV